MSFKLDDVVVSSYRRKYFKEVDVSFCYLYMLPIGSHLVWCMSCLDCSVDFDTPLFEVGKKSRKTCHTKARKKLDKQKKNKN